MRNMRLPTFVLLMAGSHAFAQMTLEEWNKRLRASELASTRPSTLPATRQSESPSTRPVHSVPAQVGGRTLAVRPRGPLPRDVGDCFSLVWEGRHVINMHVDNFEGIVKRLGLTHVEVEPVGEKWCIIVDKRIPRQWLRNWPCTICVPSNVAQEVSADHFRLSQ